jgi:oxidase EvaA
MSLTSCSNELLASAVCSEGVHPEKELLDWVEKRNRAHNYSVQPVPLEKLSGWHFEASTGNLIHSTGKFFRVEGLAIKTNAGSVHGWMQPILNQPEVGILGFLAKRIDGVLHLLVQAKMEPGNINLIQLSPTVQATRSNYTQVHGGRRPMFMGYFLGEERVRVLTDQLQSEQGARYLRKRNRNVIMQISDDALMQPPEDFRWLTIGQLQRLARQANLVHLDCRSILGGTSLGGADAQEGLSVLLAADTFQGRVLASIRAGDSQVEKSLAEILSWLAHLKCHCEQQVRSLPLKEVVGWKLQDGVIRHETGRFFSIVGMAVQAASREVASWHQPLVKSMDGGIIGLITQMRNGILHFLIQGRTEPGFLDLVELAPTVQCAPANYLQGTHTPLPAFVEFLQAMPRERIRFDTMLSEEGGRFYHSQQRHLVVELEPDVSIEIPPSYCWMSLGQIHECARFNNLLNIELRSILACVPLAGCAN